MLALPDLLVVGGIALLIFGPKQLPELAKSLGTGIRDFKKALDGEDEPKNEPKSEMEKLVNPTPPSGSEPKSPAPAPSH